MPRKPSRSGGSSHRTGRGPGKNAGKGASEGAGPTQRMLRVGEMMRHAMAQLLTRGDIHNDVLATHVITISEVRMSSDLKLGTAYVMPLGGGDIEPVLKALDENRGMIRSACARAVNLKFAPDVRFRADKSFDEGYRIDMLLDSPAVKRDVEK